MDVDELLSTDEAAKELGVTRRRVQAMIAAGQIKAKRVGRDWVMTRAALDPVRVRRRGGPAPAPRNDGPTPGRSATPERTRELLLEWAGHHAGTIDLDDFAPAMAMAGWFGDADEARSLAIHQLYLLEAEQTRSGVYRLPAAEVPAAG